MADVAWYSGNTRPRVYINWTTFEDWGIPSSWRTPFTNMVINTYTRWMNVAGVDVRFQFWGYTDATDVDDDDLVIYMNEKHARSRRLASWFGAKIVFHRKRGSDLSPWPFVPYNAEPGQFDMSAILMHELGHALGLDHSASGSPTIMGSYGYFDRFGPFASDVADVRNVHADFRENRLRQMRSTDGGQTWSPVPNDLTTHGHWHARTNLNPGVTARPGDDYYVVGWSMPGRVPTWLRGTGHTFPKRNWFFYGGQRSCYGPTYAGDDDRTMLWAWVDDDSDGTIKIVRSRNGGFGWGWVGVPSGATTKGTPALCWTRVDGRSTWILVWSHYDRGARDETGHLRASVSTDDGGTWSTPVVLDDFYRALSGVSVAASPDNEVVAAFAWAPHGTYGMNRVRAFNCAVSDGSLVKENTVFSNESTRIQPALAYDRGADRFVMAWRGQDFRTTLLVASKDPGDRFWSRRVHLSDARSHVAPDLTYSAVNNELVLWYAFE